MQDLPIDVSSLVELVCARRYYLRCVLGIGTNNIAATYGSAIHKYIEQRDKGHSPNAIELCAEHGLIQEMASFLFVCKTCDMMELPKAECDSDNVSLIEYKFAFPYVQLENTDIRIILCGTMDRVDMPEQAVRVLDWKTSRKMKFQEVLADYQTRLQIPFYMYVLKHFLKDKLPARYQEALDENKLYGQVGGIFISPNPPVVQLSSSIALTEHLENDIPLLLGDMIHKAYTLHNAELPYPEGMAYNSCSQCPYLQFCVIKDKSRMMSVINQQPRKPYNPLEHR